MTLPPPPADLGVKTMPQDSPDPVETPGADRVRAHTSPEVLSQLDRDAEQRIASYADASPATLTRRIEELEHESDIERWLEINASILALAGVALGGFRSRRFLAFPIVILSFLLQHGVQGWCPPVPLLRRLGVRTRQEIDAEKYRLKALRGDFGPNALSPNSGQWTSRSAARP
jgi:hypothetical protein